MAVVSHSGPQQLSLAQHLNFLLRTELTEVETDGPGAQALCWPMGRELDLRPSRHPSAEVAILQRQENLILDSDLTYFVRVEQCVQLS